MRPSNIHPKYVDMPRIKDGMRRRYGLTIEKLKPESILLTQKIMKVGEIPETSTHFDKTAVLSTLKPKDQEIARTLFERHDGHIATVIKSNPEVFKVRELVEVDGGVVGIGSPINIGYSVVPVYVRSDGETKLVFAYRSKSQESWRRFAGYVQCTDQSGDTHNIFWKGENKHSEHIQNLHWKIQRAIDLVYAQTQKPIVLSLSADSPAHHLSQLGINAVVCNDRESRIASSIITNAEQLIQDAMLEGTIKLALIDDKPNSLVAFWWSGDSKEGAYGFHLNFVVACRTHLCCVAVTDEGLFIKYFQPFTPGINSVGAPIKGTLPSDDNFWLLTPILEYSSFADKLAATRRKKGVTLGLRNTMMFDPLEGSTRKRISGLHTDPDSQLYELNTGLRRVFRLMREERYSDIADVLQKICSNGRKLPSSASLPDTQLTSDPSAVHGRLITLQNALDQFIPLLSDSGRVIDISEYDRTRLMEEYNLTTRESYALLRYARFIMNYADRLSAELAAGNDSGAAAARYNRKKAEIDRCLAHRAEVWAMDRDAHTSFSLPGI
ncbi:MAG: hypothetical protein ABID61_04050 [Candidatus Micrarchaeota archaeon]